MKEGAEPLSRTVSTAMRSVPGAFLCISDLVRLECLVGVIRSGDRALRAAYDERFRRLTRLPLTASVYDAAAELRARANLKLPDALHAAAALVHGCDELWTNDSRLHALDNRIRVRALGV